MSSPSSAIQQPEIAVLDIVGTADDTVLVQNTPPPLNYSYTKFLPFIIKAAINLVNGTYSTGHQVGYYKKKAKKMIIYYKRARSHAVITVLIGLTLILSIRKLKAILLMGCELWKWSLLVSMVLCGYTVISLVTRLLLDLMCTTLSLMKTSGHATYFAYGLRQSVNLIILSWSLLFTWLFYFNTDRALKRRTPEPGIVRHVGTWSFATFAIGAVLWLIKDVLLRVWEANVVYGRFEDRILCAGFHSYFLAHILIGGERKLKKKQKRVLQILSPIQQVDKKDDIYKPKTNEAAYQEKHPSARFRWGVNVEAKIHEAHQDTTTYHKPLEVPSSHDNTNRGEEGLGPASPQNKDTVEERKRKAKESLRKERLKLYKGKTTYDIKQMTQYIMARSEESSREDDGTSDVLNKCIEYFNPSNTTKDISAKDLKGFFSEDDSKLLIKDLCREHHLEESEKISYENFEKSMVRGHKNCVALGHTLSDAIAAVDVLNKVMTGGLITIAIIAWLLLTDIATTKILVLIASPFLASTFMFGDAGKKTFEGLMFSFLSHPFDVGDQCIIDGLELEVKRMGIMTTKFMLIATKEEALYPNSALATKFIINLKGEPNPSDRVELKLDRSCTSKVTLLKDKIATFLKDDNCMRFERENTIIVEEIGSYIRVTIHYRHVMSIYEVTHSQCYEKKRTQRSEFLLKIAQLMDASDIKVAES